MKLNEYLHQFQYVYVTQSSVLAIPDVSKITFANVKEKIQDKVI